MKINKLQVLAVVVPTLLVGCNSGSSGGNSPDNLDNVSVQRVFPPSGTTNMGVGEHIQVKFSKAVNPDLVKQYITLNNLTKNNESLYINVTQGQDGYIEINPIIGLQPDTTYSYSINLPSSESGQNTQSSSENTFTVTTQPAYKIFLTSQTAKGNLASAVDNMNAKQYADSICGSDASRPNTSVTYKAMLGVQDIRYACDDDKLCGMGHNLDWVLQASSAYYNVSDQTIAITSIFNTFTFPASNYINYSDTTVWTGLSKEWFTDTGCNEWASNNGDKKGRIGRANQVNDTMLQYDKRGCNELRHLYCVQQPQAVITSPELSPINQYIITNYVSPITVMFNSVNPIDPATVTTSSFSIILSSTGTPVPGVITNNGNNSFTFFPHVAYNPGSQYLVNLTTDIKDTLGTPITQTTLFFNTAASTKLMYMTNDTFWGDIGSITGADSKCQVDPQCPAGSTCKAVVMQVNTRYACTSNTTCGGVYSKDWVLTPFTTYINTSGQIISTTNESSIFGSDGKYVFNNPIAPSGYAWTGFDQYFMIKYDSGSPATCSSWSIGDSGVNALGGLYGDASSVYPYAFTKDGGGCSQYTNKVDYGVYIDKQCNAPGGCSKRHIYCAQQ